MRNYESNIQLIALIQHVLYLCIEINSIPTTASTQYHNKVLARSSLIRLVQKQP